MTRAFKRLNDFSEDGDIEVEDLMIFIDEAASGTSAVFAPSTAYSILRREYKRLNKILNPNAKRRAR
ncbi:MAG: hypothetical protein GY750_14085 [Lentisphaerae bacterium]|nr:hypothetical protein [Lentisphaerota bacterium]MCP4102529.1 hypothetical protein [Lentisphaerota bacterium]